MQIEWTEVSVQWVFNHIIREFAKAEWILPESCGLSFTPQKDLTVPAEKNRSEKYFISAQRDQ